MAFRSSSVRASSSNVAAPANDSWKAAGFLNFSVPAYGGGMKKLGAIPLRASNAREKSLADWLGANPTNAAKLNVHLEITYQMASSTASGWGFINAAPVAVQVEAGQKRAAAWITFSVNGDRIGAIPLYAQDADQNQLIEFLNADEDNVQVMVDAISLAYQPVVSNKVFKFDELEAA